MKPINSKVVVETSGLTEQVGFSAKVKNLGVLFHILRNQLYSNPILAVIREYSTNARDAHTAAGKGKKPIQITFPTNLESFFKIRDFGKGLDEDGIKEIFASYGESTKRNTNAQTGMLGIGCKSAFAYGDSYLINSYRGGKMTSWSAFLDPSQQGQIAKMAEDDTTEPDGLEIVVAVRTPDIQKFRAESLKFFVHFDILPDFKNIEEVELTALNIARNDTGRYFGEGWKLLCGANASLANRSLAVMGNIAYPINPDIFKDEVGQEIKDMLKVGIVVQFKTGELEFAASREALQYTAHTKAKLQARLEKIYKEILTQTQKEFEACKTLWEARLLHKEVFSSNGKLYGLRSLFKPSNLLFGNHPINGDQFTLRVTGMSASVYKELSGRVSRENAYEIPVSKDITVVENDTNICNLIVNRIAPVLKNGSTKMVFLVKFEDAAAKAEWIRLSGYDGPIVSLDTLPRKSLAEFYPFMVMPSASFNRKHALKEFELDVSMVLNNRSGNPSDFWSEVTVDAGKDEGVYTPLERFEGKAFSYGYQHPREWDTFLSDLTNLGIVLPRIYGFKKSSAEAARNNPKMKMLSAWVTEAVANYFAKNPAVEQSYINRITMNSFVNDSHKDLNELAEMVKKWKEFPNNSLKKFLAHFQDVTQKCAYVQNFEAIERCINLTHYQLKAKNNLSLEDGYKAEMAKYPMFMLSAQMAGSYNLNYRGDWKKASLDYINMVDGIYAVAQPVPQLMMALPAATAPVAVTVAPVTV